MAVPVVTGLKVTSVLEISEFREKPTREFVEEHMQVERLEKNSFLTMFGIYVPTPAALWSCLEGSIRRNLRESGVFGPTPTVSGRGAARGRVRRCHSAGTQMGYRDSGRVSSGHGGISHVDSPPRKFGCWGRHACVKRNRCSQEWKQASWTWSRLPCPRV
jgi:hypothetical protein